MPETIDRLNTALEGRYAIERQIGEGGMSVVYLATDVRHQRQVAIKVLRRELAASIGPERFLQEIRVTANLQHPHILPLFDSGEVDGFVFYVMPYLEGESLRDRLTREGELPVAEAARILKNVTDALSAAHAAGIVHRDIKPDNVMITGRHAMVTDFGVAKALSEATGLAEVTTTGIALGTPAYMAPEQAAAHEHIDHRVDLYAVGVLGYELLSGRTPFGGMSAQQVLLAQVTQQPQPLTERRATVPEGLSAVLMRCLEKKAADRWQTAEELLEAFDLYSTTTAGMTPTHASPVAPRKKSLSRAVGAVIAVVGVIAGTLWWGAGVGLAPIAGAPELDPELIAVLPFRLAGDVDSLQDLREAMIDLIELRLGPDIGLRSVNARTMLKAWREVVGDDERTDLADPEALALARSLGAGRVLLGRVFATTDEVTIDARVLSVPAGDSVLPLQETGSLGEVVETQTRFLTSLLGLTTGARELALSSLEDAPWEAQRAFLRGRSRRRQGRYLEALEYYETALEIDPTFAEAAFARFLMINRTGGRFAGLEAAFALRDRLNPGARARVDASSSPVSQYLGNLEKALEYDPRDPEVWLQYGQALAKWGEFWGLDDWEDRATEALDSALVLDPQWQDIIGFSIEHAATIGDTTRLRGFLQAYLAIDSASRDVNFYRWRVAVALNDEPESERAIAGFTYDNSTRRLTTGAVDGLPFWDDHRDFVEALVNNPPSEFYRGRGAFHETLAHVLEGRPTEAIHAWSHPLMRGLPTFLVRHAIAESAYDDAAAELVSQIGTVSEGVPSEEFDICVTELWKVRNRLDSSTVRGSMERLAQIGERWAPHERHNLEHCPTLLEAQLEAITAESGSSRPNLERMDSVSRGGDILDIGNVTNLFLAQEWEKLGEDQRALAAIRRRPKWDLNGPLWELPTMLRVESCLAEKVGDMAGAIRAAENYLVFRGGASPGPEPILAQELREIQDRLARLEGGDRPVSPGCYSPRGS